MDVSGIFLSVCIRNLVIECLKEIVNRLTKTMATSQTIEIHILFNIYSLFFNNSIVLDARVRGYYIAKKYFNYYNIYFEYI